MAYIDDILVFADSGVSEGSHQLCNIPARESGLYNLPREDNNRIVTGGRVLRNDGRLASNGAAVTRPEDKKAETRGREDQ